MENTPTIAIYRVTFHHDFAGLRQNVLEKKNGTETYYVGIENGFRAF